MTAIRRFESPELDSYWESVSSRHAGASEDGLELICYAGMPSWFNNLIHTYQVRAFRSLVVGETFAGSRVLDIGTGVGRWARWYAAAGAQVTGIDLEPARLIQAERRGGGITYRTMRADCLEFEDGSFDVFNSVTVLQHTPHEVKRAAIAEVARVAAPNARVILFELTDMSDDAPHVFPWPAQQWEAAFAKHGFRVQRRIGTEYIPLLRAAKKISLPGNSAGRRTNIDAIKDGRRTLADRLKLGALHAAVVASYPMEEAAMRFAPRSAARINGWLLKRGRSG